jgi:hypothetical protein
MTNTRWVTSAGTMRAIADVDPEIAQIAFASERSIALGGWPRAVAGQSWASCAQFETDVASGAIPADVRVAMYDPERWRQTPTSEQRDPVSAIARFGEMARGLGYQVMITPHPGLVSVKGAVFTRDDDESEEDAYERSGIAEAAARAADIVETQAQRLQNDPSAIGRSSRRPPSGHAASTPRSS